MMCLQVMKDVKIKKEESWESRKEQVNSWEKEWNCLGKKSLIFTQESLENNNTLFYYIRTILYKVIVHCFCLEKWHV